ncbi:tRNA 2'-phosphotransferase [Saguinus oedipus]|uniref:Translationally-controlled tumor protein n=1 Tax=Saguinus oedipus TaxID=9490 RepID=A0ABQ9U5Z1_SAGOE|nr:tRNA 2'-phosphotransferase [Saguinus oedipus]
MIIYPDLISHEMFSNIYSIWKIADELCLKVGRGVGGKMVSRTEGNIDRNASTEGPEGEGIESTLITYVDTVMNHHLQETNLTKEAYKKYIKYYIKSIKGQLEER